VEEGNESLSGMNIDGIHVIMWLTFEDWITFWRKDAARHSKFLAFCF